MLAYYYYYYNPKLKRSFKTKNRSYEKYLLSEKIKTLSKVDLDKLDNMEMNELMDLVRLYVRENGELQNKNDELFSSKELLQRDHELVCRENERLSRKLEELAS